MKILVVGYWVWFGISVIVLSRRLIVRVTSGPKAARRARAATANGGLGPLDAPPGSADDRARDDLASRVAARLAASVPAVADAPAADSLAAAPAVTPTVAAPGAPVAPGLPRPTRSELAGARTTLAEVLRGITMPAGLAPLVHVAGTDPERRAVFCTSGRAVELVGAEVADELARLGFVLEATNATDALARRGDHAVAVRMRAIGPQPPKGPADPAYPTAPAGSVVLDVELA